MNVRERNLTVNRVIRKSIKRKGWREREQQRANQRQGPGERNKESTK